MAIWGGLTIAVKREKQKVKEKRKDKHLNAEFQRIARRDKKAFLSSWSCFCWPYRASPSLAAKNIINMISVLTIWICPHVESSLVLLEEGVCYDQCIFLAKFYVFVLLHSSFQGQICLYSRCFLTSFFFIPVPYNEKGIVFLVSVLEGLVCLHRTVQLQLLQHYW